MPVTQSQLRIGADVGGNEGEALAPGLADAQHFGGCKRSGQDTESTSGEDYGGASRCPRSRGMKTRHSVSPVVGGRRSLAASRPLQLH